MHRVHNRYVHFAIITLWLRKQIGFWSRIIAACSLKKPKNIHHNWRFSVNVRVHMYRPIQEFNIVCWNDRTTHPAMLWSRLELHKDVNTQTASSYQDVHECPHSPSRTQRRLFSVIHPPSESRTVVSAHTPGSSCPCRIPVLFVLAVTGPVSTNSVRPHEGLLCLIAASLKDEGLHRLNCGCHFV